MMFFPDTLKLSKKTIIRVIQSGNYDILDILDCPLDFGNDYQLAILSLYALADTYQSPFLMSVSDAIKKFQDKIPNSKIDDSKPTKELNNIIASQNRVIDELKHMISDLTEQNKQNFTKFTKLFDNLTNTVKENFYSTNSMIAEDKTPQIIVQGHDADEVKKIVNKAISEKDQIIEQLRKEIQTLKNTLENPKSPAATFGFPGFYQMPQQSQFALPAFSSQTQQPPQFVEPVFSSQTQQPPKFTTFAQEPVFSSQLIPQMSYPPGFSGQTYQNIDKQVSSPKTIQSSIEKPVKNVPLGSAPVITRVQSFKKIYDTFRNTSDSKIIKHLQEYKNHIDSDGNNLLIYVIQSNINVTESRIKKFIEAGYDVNFKGKNGRTALWFACELGLNKIVRYLLSLPNIIYMPDNNNVSPYIIASRNNRQKVMKRLIEKGFK